MLTPSPGARVVVRHRLPEPDPTGANLTDVVGELVSIDDEHLVVRRAGQGEVTVERSLVTALRVVPPRATRPGPPHRTITVADLQRIMIDAWPPVERESLGEWVLRASGGFTRRAGSVLAVGDPARPVPAAVEAARHWYAARGLPLSLAVAGPVGFRPPPLLPGGETLDRAVTMTARTRSVLMATAGVDLRQVSLSEELDEQWLSSYARSRSLVPGASQQVLTGSPQQVFAMVGSAETGCAVARLGLAHGWGGIAATWVPPQHRHRGLGTALTAALAHAADRHRASLLHLQVQVDNVPAVELYRRLGFTVHHEYAYLGERED